MATTENTWNVANRLHSQKDSDNPEVNHIVAGADEIFDDVKRMNQEDINATVDETLENHATLISALDNQNYKSYTATDQDTEVSGIVPSADRAVNTLYRIGCWDGTQYDSTCYSEYIWVSGDDFVLMDVKQYGIDEVPTPGSTNLVESGGVEKELQLTNDSIGLHPFALEFAAAGEKMYSVVAGTYVITTGAPAVTVSFRKTQAGENHLTTVVPANSSVEIEVDDSYEWVRCGSAGSFTIKPKNNVVDNTNRLLEKQNNDLNLHSSIAKIAIQPEAFKSGLYWYSNNGVIASLTNSSTQSAVATKIPVSAGDEIRVNITSSLLFTDGSGNVVTQYSQATLPLDGKITVPTNAVYMYVNTLTANVASSWCFVNLKLIPDIKKELLEL